MSDAFVRGVLPKIVAAALDYSDFGLGQSPPPPVKFFLTKSNIALRPNQMSGAFELLHGLFKFG